MAAQLITILGVLLGAASSYLAGSARERTRHRRDLSKQWVERKLDAYVNYINEVKQMRAIARRIIAGIELDARPTSTLPQVLSRDEGLPLLAEAETRRSIA